MCTSNRDGDVPLAPSAAGAAEPDFGSPQVQRHHVETGSITEVNNHGAPINRGVILAITPP